VLTARLLAPATARQLVVVRAGFAAVIGLRIALGPYRALAGQPAALFRPVSFLQVLGSMPSRPAMVLLQVVGTVPAALVLARRWPRAAFAIAWICLLVLAGLRSSLGKILHNDVLLLLGSFPLLFASPISQGDLEGDESRVRFGWPLSVGSAVVALAYFLTGIAKLRHSGLAWVTSDNMRYVMAAAGRSGLPEFPGIAIEVSQHAALSHGIAAGILGVELAFPLAFVLPSARPWLAVAVAVLHVGTWLTLGLDYWTWIATVWLLFLLPVFEGRAIRRGRLLVAGPPAAADLQHHRDQ
jgi:hypothetical protein